ncbi:MAG TPA: hypothetical protein VGQ55_09875, partial [Pyrinomonadaceae bacterium]|nr:hypothetical protein [Pyrinomonadaceae bacterium]
MRTLHRQYIFSQTLDRNAPELMLDFDHYAPAGRFAQKSRWDRRNDKNMMVFGLGCHFLEDLPGCVAVAPVDKPWLSDRKPFQTLVQVTPAKPEFTDLAAEDKP